MNKSLSVDGGHLRASRRRFDGPVEIVLAFLLTNLVYGIPLVLGPSLGTQAASVLSIMTTFVAAGVLILWDPRIFFLFWIHIVLLQNIAAGIWHGANGGVVPVAVTEAKTIALLVAVLFSLTRLWKLLRSSRQLLLGCLIYSVGILVNLTSFGPSALANLRNLTIPLLSMLLAMAHSNRFATKTTYEFLRKTLLVVSFWLAFGTICELSFGTADWRQLLNADAIVGLASLSQETSFFGIELSRVGGVLVEAVNAGYVAASVLIIVIVLRVQGTWQRFGLAGWFTVISAASALLAAATKNGAMMFLILIASVAMIRWLRVNHRVTLLLSWIIAFLATLVYATIVQGAAYIRGVWANPIGMSGGESTSIHMAGLISGFKNLANAPFGMGIGSGGNFYRTFNPEITRVDWLSRGSESGWGMLAYQLGIVGLLGFIMVLFAVVRNGSTLTCVIVCVWSSAALFAESFFGPIASSLLMISAGILSSNVKSKNLYSYSSKGIENVATN